MLVSVFAQYFVSRSLITTSAIIVLRVWHLYSGRPIGRAFIMICFGASIVIDVVLIALGWTEMNSLYIPSYGCIPMKATHAWRMSVHHLVLHSILYLLTTFPALQSWYQHKNSPLITHILREYAFYLTYGRSTADVHLMHTVVGSSTSPY